MAGVGRWSAERVSPERRTLGAASAAHALHDGFAGSIPDLVPETDHNRAFGIYYTATIGAAAATPIVFGLVGDLVGVPTMMLLVAFYILLTVPLALMLRTHIRD